MNANDIITLRNALQRKLDEANEAEAEAEEVYLKVAGRYEALTDLEYYGHEAEEEALFEEAERRYRLAKELREEAGRAVDLAGLLWGVLSDIDYLEAQA